MTYTEEEFNTAIEKFKSEYKEVAKKEITSKIDEMFKDVSKQIAAQVDAQVKETGNLVDSSKYKWSKLLNDVSGFHGKFDIPINESPGFCDKEAMQFRANFIQEEFDEFKDAIETNDLPEAFDALIDIVYIALGTIDMMGLTNEEFCLLWNDVVRANMSKVRSTGDNDPLSKRKSKLDIVKPHDFVAARSVEITEQIIADRA